MRLCVLQGRSRALTRVGEVAVQVAPEKLRRIPERLERGQCIRGRQRYLGGGVDLLHHCVDKWPSEQVKRLQWRPIEKGLRAAREHPTKCGLGAARKYNLNGLLAGLQGGDTAMHKLGVLRLRNHLRLIYNEQKHLAGPVQLLQ